MKKRIKQQQSSLGGREEIQLSVSVRKWDGSNGSRDLVKAHSMSAMQLASFPVFYTTEKVKSLFSKHSNKRLEKISGTVLMM